MKKVLALAALVAIFSTANAQFGVKGALNISTWRGDDIEDASSLLGLNLGVYYNAALSENFSIEPQLDFSTEGVKVEGDDAKFKTNFINLSALARYNSPSGFFVGTGPQIGLMVSSKAEDGGVSADADEIFNSTNISWALTTGYQSPTAGIGGFIRYNFGLTNIIDEDALSAEAKTSVFQVGLRYNITKLVGGGKSK
jgi:hypothetical protein